MYDDNFEKSIAEACDWSKKRNESIITEWLKEINFNGTIGYYISYDGIVTIYSNRCGILIGKAGKNINILKDILNKEHSKKEWVVKFIENHGEFITV